MATKTLRNTSSSVRLQDVAQLAGVNMMTVSRVLNHPGKVAEPTREKVLAAIKKTGYVPNLMAGSLATNKSHIIGCIVPTLDNSIFAQTVRVLGDALANQGYQLLLGQSNYDFAQEDKLVTTFLGRKVDGMVLTGGMHSAITVKRLKHAKIPVVETWDLPKDANFKPIDQVAGFSNYDAGKAVGDYLRSKGYQQICFAGGPDERSSVRYAGLQASCRKALRIEVATGASFAGGAQIVASLTTTALPDAIFFGNDALAAGAIFECQRRGIKVPTDVAVFGFADLDIAASLEPALSTVRVPTSQMGQGAAEMLLAKLDPTRAAGKQPAKVQDLGFELVLRQSA